MECQKTVVSDKKRLQELIKVVYDVRKSVGKNLENRSQQNYNFKVMTNSKIIGFANTPRGQCRVKTQ